MAWDGSSYYVKLGYKYMIDAISAGLLTTASTASYEVWYTSLKFYSHDKEILYIHTFTLNHPHFIKEFKKVYSNLTSQKYLA